MPVEVSVSGWTLTDRAAAPRAQLVAEWIWEKNNMTPKRERLTRDRLKFGTGIYKVFFDGTAGAVGFPRIEPVSPKNFFPDPKVRSHTQLHMADYIIHAVPRSLRYLKRRYKKAAQLRPEPHRTTIQNCSIRRAPPSRSTPRMRFWSSNAGPSRTTAISARWSWHRASCSMTATRMRKRASFTGG
jgi:hypothetical protein